MKLVTNKSKNLSIKNLEISNKNIKRLKYKTTSGSVDLGIIPSNSGYILNEYNNLTEELLEENIEKDNINYHIPDKTNILLNKIEGKTNKIVQLLDKSKFSSTTTNKGITFTNNNNGTFTANGTASDGAATLNLQTSLGVISGHKYLVDVGNVDNACVQLYTGETANIFEAYNIKYTPQIITCKTTYDAVFYQIIFYDGITVNNAVLRPQFFDLTAMYGYGKEPTTVEQFKKDYPNFFDEKLDDVYSVETSGIATTSENIYGLEDFIKKNNASDMIVTYDGKKCFKISRAFNPTYYFPLGNYSLNFKGYTTYGNSFCSYGKYENGNYIIKGYVNATIGSSWINKHYNLTDCNFISWYNEVPSDKVLYIDIDSFSLSSGIDDTNSYTYQENKIDLLSTQTLNGINGVNDYIEVIDKGNGLYDLKKTQNIDSVDLGTLNWYTETLSSGINFYSTYTADKVVLSSYLLCQKYTSALNSTYRNSVFLGITGNLNINADGYTTADAFKTAVSGVYLYYQLKTPVTTTIATNLTYSQVSSLRTNGGLLLVNDNNNQKYVQPDVTIKENYQYKN